ncbi:adenylate/guanylate cyclase domain-containing protein [Anaerolineales bacterium HSG25]|nr:adenylate/guanylate cyclase domain-containing protein [Anaerolineales bacterium HSG25]
MTSHIQPTNWPNLRLRLARYLPVKLFNRLRQLPDNLDDLESTAQEEASEQLVQAVKALSPLHRVLIQYMPHYLLGVNPTPNQPHGELIEGSFIFADVSGFTALTELLARAGDAKGREVMNRIMNQLFSSVLDPITASGGDMLIFVGDAALVFFPKETHNNDLLQAIRAGLRMQRAIEHFQVLETEFGTCSLSMSIGIEQGTAYAGVVGTQNRMELLISGPAIYRAMGAEGIAQSGQVRLGEQALTIAKDHFTMDDAFVIDDLGENLGDYEITAPTRKRGSTVFFGTSFGEILVTLENNLKRVERLAPFVPEDMLALLVNTDRRRKLQSEFRPVATQFINIIGLEELAINQGPKVATDVFQEYFIQASQIIQQHEGIISQIDAYETGFFLLNTFGVPKSHEGTSRYAVSAALQLASMLNRLNQQFELDPPLLQRGGITYGLTFNGEIGANYRRESVIAGPAVNRAARLMSKAKPGQIILDLNIWQQTQNAFIGDELPAIELKGIDQPVVIVNVRELRRGNRLPMLERDLLERDTEQTKLNQALTNLANNQQATVWVVCGETGIGKTALMSKLSEQAKAQKTTVLVGCCQPHTKHTPLSCWVDLVSGWLDLESIDSIEAKKVQLQNQLSELGLQKLASDLADFLSLPSDGLESNSNQAEGYTWPTLVIELLIQLARKNPVLVIVEDSHWIDNESLQLLQLLIDEIATSPVMLVITGHKQVINNYASRLDLQPLSDKAIVDMAQRAIGASHIDANLGEWVCKQAGGNPLYSEELCQALKHSDAVIVDRSTDEIRWTGFIPSLPLTLHELLLAKLDTLSLVNHKVLKRCAVLGGGFSDTAVLRLSQPQIEMDGVHKALKQATQFSFLTRRRGNVYYFHHPLMQEAIYSTLSFKQRQQWHKRVADWLCDNLGDEEQNLEQVVYHYMRSNNIKMAAKHGVMAGDKAREREAYAGASDYYQQVYSLAKAPDKYRVMALENHADVMALQGNYKQAVLLYPQATDLGSTTANSKVAIISGDIELLTKTIFTPQMQFWAEGSKAWVLALAGQTDTALNIAQTALNQAEGAVHTALTVLVQNLEIGRPLEAYEVWLQKFVTAILHLGLSTIDLLDMPVEQSTIVNKLARKRKMTLSDLATAISQPSADIEPVLTELVEKGHVKLVKINGKIWYKARFARKAKKKLSSKLWSALDF